MNIQDIKKLRKYERKGRLRSSSFFEQAGIKFIPELRSFMYNLDGLICNLTSSKDKNETEAILAIIRDQNSPFHIIYGEDGTAQNPFIFDFIIGHGLRGVMFQANSLFACNNKSYNDIYRQLYETLVTPNFCFKNCFDMAKELQKTIRKYPVQIISGILSNDNSKGSINTLHSVLRIRKNVADVDSMSLIIDFNHNLCMDENAYFTIFDFEPLNQVNAEEIEINKDLIEKEIKKGTFDPMYFNFATRDYLDYLSNPTRQNSENIYDDIVDEVVHALKDANIFKRLNINCEDESSPK